MKRATNRQPASKATLALSAPAAESAFISMSCATRKATVEATSGLGVPREMFTVITAVVSTDTEHVNPELAGVRLEVKRPFFGGGDYDVAFDIVASELDVVVAALTEAIKLARSSHAIAVPLAACAAAYKEASMASNPA